ncbi:MAG: ATPase domain-containing protein [Bacillota bacterium]
MADNRLSTGISGLDDVLAGGLIPNRFYLLRGGPGTGKTTLGLQFLIEGLKNKEKPLLITMTEPAQKIKENAKKYNLPVNKIKILDFSPKSDFITANKDYNVFSSAQVEQKPLIKKLTSTIENYKPQRIFFDGITQLKFLSSSDFNFRKQILSLMQFLMEFNTTVLLTSEVGNNNFDDNLRFLVDGIINLQYENPYNYVEITKYRASNFRKGTHSLKFKKKGIEVYPRLEINNIKSDYKLKKLLSGIREIDKLLNGGLEVGTTTMITGPSGVGKTTLGTQFINNHSKNDNSSIIYTFEEGYKTLLNRSRSVNIDLESLIENNNLLIQKINFMDYTLDEFTQKVLEDVEKMDAKLVLLDSISSYFLTFKDNSKNRNLLNTLHILIENLKNKGISLLLTNEMRNITGDFQITGSNTSYLADNIIFLRYLEVNAKLKKAIGVLKKRMSGFENTLREFEITSDGIKVGKPLHNLRGILSGSPNLADLKSDDYYEK